MRKEKTMENLQIGNVYFDKETRDLLKYTGRTEFDHRFGVKVYVFKSWLDGTTRRDAYQIRRNLQFVRCEA